MKIHCSIQFVFYEGNDALLESRQIIKIWFNVKFAAPDESIGD